MGWCFIKATDDSNHDDDLCRLSTLSASKPPKLESKSYLDILDRQVIIRQTVCTFSVASCWLREPWPLARKLPGQSFLHYHWSASATNYSSQSRVNGYRTWQESAIRPEERKGDTLPEERGKEWGRTNEPRFQNVIKIAASQRYIATHCVGRSVHGQREGEGAGCQGKGESDRERWKKSTANPAMAWSTATRREAKHPKFRQGR